MGSLISDLIKMARDVSGVSFVERELAVAVRDLRQRLESEAKEAQPQAIWQASDGVLNRAPRCPEPAEAQTLAVVMDGMLRRSMDQTPSESRRSLFEHLIRELVPDEARILAALADGSTYPLLDIAVASPTGKIVRVVLQNASNVGRAAGVAAPSLVPTYVTHLIHLGLVEAGREDPVLHEEYEILSTDADVTCARDEAAKAGRRKPRVVRGTLQMSTLGRDFWTACHAQ